MKALLVLVAIALLGLGTTACGTTSTGASSTPRAAPLGDGDADNPSDLDGDADNPEYIGVGVGEYTDKDDDNDKRTPESSDYHDKDDEDILGYGRAASAAQTGTITAVAKRYYTAVADDDGASACSMLTSSLGKTVAEDYGHGSAGPAYLSAGTTCAATMTLLFKHLADQPVGAVDVTGVRVKGAQAEALLGSPTMLASDISLRREAGVWKVADLIARTLP